MRGDLTTFSTCSGNIQVNDVKHFSTLCGRSRRTSSPKGITKAKHLRHLAQNKLNRLLYRYLSHNVHVSQHSFLSAKIEGLNVI